MYLLSYKLISHEFLRSFPLHSEKMLPSSGGGVPQAFGSQNLTFRAQFGGSLVWGGGVFIKEHIFYLKWN